MKAICSERVRDWQLRFGQGLGLQLVELTGDSLDFDWNALREADVIFCTPEKFDSMTRRNKDRGGMSFFADLELFAIDEACQRLKGQINAHSSAPQSRPPRRRLLRTPKACRSPCRAFRRTAAGPHAE